MTPEQIHVAAELTAWLMLSIATVIAAVLAYGFRRVATMYAHRADEVKRKYEQELERVLAAFEAHQRALRRVELDRGHWRESSYEHLRARQTLEAEMQWMANESHLAAERGEPWTFTATWPTPEELHRREMTKVLHEQNQHGEHRKTAAASGADA